MTKNRFALTPANLSVPIVYLSGPMENVTREDAIGWRYVAAAYLRKSEIYTAIPGTPGMTQEVGRCPYEAFDKDMQLMSLSKYLLVNLETLDIPRNGTAMEIMHFRYHLGRPVIGFSDDVARCMHHPFFASLVNVFPSWEDACKHIIALQMGEPVHAE